MQIRGKILSISGNIAEVCIIKENVTCGSCSACPKKLGVRDILKVAAIDGIQIGQEVVLHDTKNWLMKNKIVFSLLAFVSGIILTEFISKIISFGAYHKQIDLLGSGMATVIALVVLWVKRPRYLFRIELIGRGKTKL
ncbi:MAG: SoxR reducing system RseC family protein [Candidatus Brocadia sinica]|nr:SoxR reducing system RseC family protein [Candidatus Brocadia sinica]NUO05893.1 SoxR reducing system RseC family protein [Candidatus Brocadia sinica]